MPAFITAYKFNIAGLATNGMYMLQGEQLMWILHYRLSPKAEYSQTYAINKINARCMELAIC